MLCSSIVEGSSIDPPTANGPSHDVTNDFIISDCICAIAASEKLTDTVLFVKILKWGEADQPYTEDYGFTVAKIKNFPVESIWNELAKDTKHLFKK